MLFMVMYDISAPLYFISGLTTNGAREYTCLGLLCIPQNVSPVYCMTQGRYQYIVWNVVLELRVGYAMIWICFCRKAHNLGSRKVYIRTIFYQYSKSCYLHKEIFSRVNYGMLRILVMVILIILSYVYNVVILNRSCV